jgi:hypothetical protein
MSTKKLIASAVLGLTIISGPLAGAASARAARPVCAGLETSPSTATCSAGKFGSVTIARDGLVLTVVSVQPAPGFTARVDVATGLEVEVQFRKGTKRIDFKAEVEDGVVETRTLVRR